MKNKKILGGNRYEHMDEDEIYKKFPGDLYTYSITMIVEDVFFF